MEPQLRDALARLTNSGLLFARGCPPECSYIFKHALVQDAAYATLLRRARQRLHAKIASKLESKFAELAATQPELAAHHWAEAGSSEKAVDYWRKAGEQSFAKSAIREAVAHYGKALDQLAALPESRERDYQELGIQIALGNLLTAAKGFAAPEAAQAYARVQQLSILLGETTYLCRLLFGQWLVRVNGGEVRHAKQIAEDLLRVGQERQESAGLMMGHLAMSGMLFRWFAISYRTPLELTRAETRRFACSADRHRRPFGGMVLATDGPAFSRLPRSSTDAE